MPQAPFIVLDGIDGTGKSTQSRLLVEWLQSRGVAAARCADPGGTPLGDKLRAILLGHRDDITLRAEAMLFMASRAELVERIIRPSLEAGTVVVCDRFLLANVVYQGHAGGLDPAELWRIGRFVTQGLEPDLTLVLDLPLELAAGRRRRAAARMEARDLAYQRRVRDGFLAEAAAAERIEVIDATPAVEVLQAHIRRRVAELLRGRGYNLPDDGT
jgi:dTMP kinase